MFDFAKRFVRGYRRLAAHIVALATCPVCLDDIPVIGLREAADSLQETHFTLACRHKFCTSCLLQYVEMKIKAREVEGDQLVCPVVECRQKIGEEDLASVGGSAVFERYKSTLKRLRDEKHPNARWCPRDGCEELIICKSTGNFTCPACKTEGCFRCRKLAHRFWFCRATQEDASYLAWEKSVGDSHAIRSCPQCGMRIWKNEGCNHMRCTTCRYEFCWVCETLWDRSHYSCRDLFFLDAKYRAIAQACITVGGYFLIAAMITFIATYGFMRFVGVMFVLGAVLETLERIRDRVLQRLGYAT